MRRFGWLALALISLMLATATSARAEKRIALLIGNGAYIKVPKLPNPPNDAAAMGDLFAQADLQAFLQDEPSDQEAVQALARIRNGQR